MQVPIKSQDGISTYFREGQVMKFDEATQRFFVTATYSQSDMKDFVNPELVVLHFPFSAECTSLMLSEIATAFNTPSGEIKDVK